jgi:hypothetical protein
VSGVHIFMPKEDSKPALWYSVILCGPWGKKEL